MQTIDHRLIEVALDRTNGLDFEKFVQAFFSAVFGAEYIPLGGTHDGGADGWFAGSVLGVKDGQNFLQASVTADAKSKIRETVKRLREFGRTPNSLIYATSRTLGAIDKVEIELSDELNCRVSIRDSSYFVGHIRAYFYNRFETIEEGKKPISWARYVAHFCSHDHLSRTVARDELREYLVNEFKFEFEPNDELEKSIDKAELEELANGIYNVRKNRYREEESEKILSRNSAAMVLRVYAKRIQQSERSGANPYGYRTWWMTQQTLVRQATGALVAKHGARYMMRPEFVLHFLSEAPSKSDISKSYMDVFPSILGIQLGNRMEESAFKKIIHDARDVYDSMDESRARVILATKTSQLQSDFVKRYD